LLVLETDRAFY